jgi:glycosyltransferase involved in cell wall biosynthesis
VRVLVWQWGRRGAGPLFAAQLAAALDELPGVTALLSLSRQAELLAGPHPPRCDVPVTTYRSLAEFAGRIATGGRLVARLTPELRSLKPELAICAMPGPLDQFCQRALRRAGVPIAVVVHDAEAHPGDGFPLLMQLQRRSVLRADAVIALSAHVAERLRTGHMIRPGAPLVTTRLPPFDFGPVPPPAAHDGPPRLLVFGRLLPYKGLDLLEAALRRLGQPRAEIRIVGNGPESATLTALRAHPAVTVDNRWVTETEIASLLGWSDALVLPYREASQSGIAGSALAAGRRVLATRVGGLAEQLAGERLAILCEPEPASLAAGLAQLLSQPLAPAPSAGQLATSWRAMAGDLLEQLIAALSLRASPSAGR